METLDVRKEFGAALKRQRIQQGISQETLAERADLHRTYITDIERGARNLSLESIHRLAQALGTTMGALLAIADDPVPAGAGGIHACCRPGMDILLVEDSTADVKLTLEAFKSAGLTNSVHVVRDGAAALDFLFVRGEYAGRLPEQKPRVVLLDLHLPKVHGMDVLRRVKADEQTRGIHVIVLTASRRDEHIREAMQLGADGYIVKPVDFQNFSEVTPKLNLRWTLIDSNGPAAK